MVDLSIGPKLVGGRNSARNVRNLMDQASFLFRKGNPKGAAELYIQALEAGVQVNLIRIQDAGDMLCKIKNNPEEAAKLYIQALEKDIQVHPRKIQDVGEALCERKDNPKAAYNLYMKSLEKSNEILHVRAIVYLVSRLCDSNNFEEAVNLLVTALEQGVPIAHQVIEYTCSDIGSSKKGNDLRLAADLYMKALETLEEGEVKKIEPGSIGFIGKELGEKFKRERLKEYLEKAASLYHAALDKKIEMNNESIQYLGSELCNEISPEEGARLYEKALERVGRDVEDMKSGNLKYVFEELCAKGSKKEARSLYEKAEGRGIRIDSKNISILYEDSEDVCIKYAG